MLDEMLNADGSPRVLDRVWISSIGCADHEQIGKLTTGFGASQNGPKIGPEYTFGITMENYTDAPILIIKTSWGGKCLNTDFRSPSAGPYEFNETQLANFRKQGKDLDAIKAEKQMATGVNYRLMIDHVRHVLSDIKRRRQDSNDRQNPWGNRMFPIRQRTRQRTAPTPTFLNAPFTRLLHFGLTCLLPPKTVSTSSLFLRLAGSPPSLDNEHSPGA